MTVLEALKETLKILNGINIPVSYLQQIGVPVSEAVKYIEATINAIEKAPNPKEEEPVFEVISDDDEQQ